MHKIFPTGDELHIAMTAPNKKKVEKRKKQRERKRAGLLDSMQVAKAVKVSTNGTREKAGHALAEQSSGDSQPPLKASKNAEGTTANNSSPEENPEHPIWPDDGSLSAKNNEHIAAGLWAVDTINPNVWAGVRKYFDKTAADIVIAQEARVREEAINQAEQSTKL
mgnify:CR=1 FL=1